MKFISRLVISAILFLSVSLVLATPKSSAFDLFHQACTASNSTGNNSPTCNQAKTQATNGNTNPVSGPTGAIQSAANVFAFVTAVAGLIIIMYSAIVFATAGGTRAGDSSTRVRQARTQIVSALVGMAIVGLAWVIVTTVNTRIIH